MERPLDKMLATVVLLGFVCYGRADTTPNHCYINISQDMNDNQPLLLRQINSEFQYPRVQSPSSFELTAGKAELRVACPNDLLVVDSETLNVGSGFLKCHGGSSFGVAGSQVSTPFSKIGCSKPAMLMTRLKRNNCPVGKCMQVGFNINVFTFLPVIDTIAYDTENRVPLWVHVKIVASIEGRQKSRETIDYKMGPLLSNTTVEVSDIYNRDYQRRRLGAIFDDPDRSEWYLSHILTPIEKYFVEGQLISPNDLFYRSQQSSTYFYENTVPMWPGVRDGNWLHVSNLLRKLASETMTDLYVWSGAIGILTLQSSSGVQRKIFMARDGSGKSILPVPKLLFKYVHDKKFNRGLVFIVVNNPYLDKVYTGDLVICKRQTICENLFPQFAHLDKGFTYCCTLDGFLETARSLGLPTFTGATSIGN